MPVPLIPVAVIALLGLIALLTGTHFIGLTVRDIVTGESTPVELAEEENVNNIINDPTLTFEQKMALLEAMRGDDKTEMEELMHKALVIIIVVSIAYVVATYMRER